MLCVDLCWCVLMYTDLYVLKAHKSQSRDCSDFGHELIKISRPSVKVQDTWKGKCWSRYLVYDCVLLYTDIYSCILMYTHVYDVAGGGVAVSEAFSPSPEKLAQRSESSDRPGLPSQLLPSPGRARKKPSCSPSLEKCAPPSPESHCKPVLGPASKGKEPVRGESWFVLLFRHCILILVLHWNDVYCCVLLCTSVYCCVLSCPVVSNCVLMCTAVYWV
jgi:hypothetical protein